MGHAIESALGMRAAGVTLASAGVILLLYGLTRLLDAHRGAEGTLAGAVGAVFVGALVGLAGLVSLLVGIPLWAAGEARLRQSLTIWTCLEYTS
jgi:hypothetical protein